MFKNTVIVRNLLLINILVFTLDSLFSLHLASVFGLRYFSSEAFRPYQLLTHLFVHGSLRHLFSNMISLLTLGTSIEYVLGSRKFLAFYLFTGIGASLLYMGMQYLEISRLEQLYLAYLESPTPERFVAFVHKFPQGTNYLIQSLIEAFSRAPSNSDYIDQSKSIVSQLYHFRINIPTVGASGSIFGIFTAFSMLFPHAHVFFIFFPIPLPARYAVFLYGAYEFYVGIGAHPADNVAHFAHLGGILYGYLFIRWWRYRQYH